MQAWLLLGAKRERQKAARDLDVGLMATRGDNKAVNQFRKELTQ